jgi:hypothetical protein
MAVLVTWLRVEPLGSETDYFLVIAWAPDYVCLIRYWPLIALKPVYGLVLVGTLMDSFNPANMTFLLLLLQWSLCCSEVHVGGFNICIDPIHYWSAINIQCTNRMNGGLDLSCCACVIRDYYTFMDIVRSSHQISLVQAGV